MAEAPTENCSPAGLQLFREETIITRPQGFTVVYFETTRIERRISAASVEAAIYESEKLRADGNWDGCDETTLGTNGVLLKVIRDAGITPADMEAAYDGHWAAISSLAEVNIPNAATRTAVLARLKERA